MFTFFQRLVFQPVKMVAFALVMGYVLVPHNIPVPDVKHVC